MGSGEEAESTIAEGCCDSSCCCCCWPGPSSPRFVSTVATCSDSLEGLEEELAAASATPGAGVAVPSEALSCLALSFAIAVAPEGANRIRASKVLSNASHCLHGAGGAL